jgi:predicted acylesterase/phospholipase RssA
LIDLIVGTSIGALMGGADVVIGVDVGSSFSRTCTIEDGIDSMNRAMEIMNFHLRQKDRDNPDILTEPAVNNIEWTNVCNFQELIHLGESQAFYHQTVMLESIIQNYDQQ